MFFHRFIFHSNGLNILQIFYTQTTLSQQIAYTKGDKALGQKLHNRSVVEQNVHNQNQIRWLIYICRHTLLPKQCLVMQRFIYVSCSRPIFQDFLSSNTDFDISTLV